MTVSLSHVQLLLLDDIPESATVKMRARRRQSTSTMVMNVHVDTYVYDVLEFTCTCAPKM